MPAAKIPHEKCDVSSKVARNVMILEDDRDNLAKMGLQVIVTFNKSNESN